jgi:hypothetical protein
VLDKQIAVDPLDGDGNAPSVYRVSAVAGDVVF